VIANLELAFDQGRCIVFLGPGGHSVSNPITFRSSTGSTGGAICEFPPKIDNLPVVCAGAAPKGRSPLDAAGQDRHLAVIIDAWPKLTPNQRRQLAAFVAAMVE
jgi:hypothetical protein